MSDGNLNFIYRSGSGVEKAGSFGMQDYLHASREGVRLTQILAQKYPDADPKFGTAFEQACQSHGIYVKDNPQRGVRATTVAEMMNGTGQVQLAGETLSKSGIITSPGSGPNSTPASRLFGPEIVLEFITDALIEDYGQEEASFNSLISGTDNIPGSSFTQPIINVTAPRAERSAPISQNALPKTLISITASQTSKNIATNSIGLQISEQAARTATFDVVRTVFEQQTQGERQALLWDSIGGIIGANPDIGQSALTPVAVSTLDGSAGGGIITQKAWLRMLYDPTRKVSRTAIIGTLAGYEAIVNRGGRPLATDPNVSPNANTGNLGSYGPNVEPVLLNYAIAPPKLLLVPNDVVSDDHLIMFDPRNGLRKAVDVTAAYSAMEQMVLQRSMFFRVDWGWMIYRFRDESFQVIDIAS